MELLLRLRRDPGRTGLFFDFDGTLSDIVSRPELASPYLGIPHLLGELAARYAVVAVVSGRTKEQLYNTAKRLKIDGRSKMTKAQLERAVERARR